MIKSVQSSDSVACKPVKNFTGVNDKKKKKSLAFESMQLQQAMFKYNLACLWAATAQLENARLRQELANASAQANYCKACYQ